MATLSPTRTNYNGGPRSVTSRGMTCDPDRSSMIGTGSRTHRFPLISRGGGGGSLNNVSHAKTYYNNPRNQVYARFSESDWSASNSAHFRLSESERSKANRLKLDVYQNVKIADEKSKARQANATRKLNERVREIDYWRQELDTEIRNMEHEQELLKDQLKILSMALNHTARPLGISEECLIHREKRIGIDQVKDEVERNLTKEVQLIRKCQSQMKDLLDKALVQTKMNRANQNECEKDLKDKNQAHVIDDTMFQLKNSSPGIAYYPGIEMYDNTISVPTSWIKFTQENLARSQKCRAQSEALRADIDQVLRACSNLMWSQFNAVNNAVTTRVQEITNARNKLQAHLKKTMQEIFDCEKAVDLLRKAILDKEAPLKVAETRLNERTRRLNVELCNDPVMKSLQKEVSEIRDLIRQLKDKKRNAEITLNRLNNAKTVLEKDIAIKENSIQIDQKHCLGMRKSFPMDPAVGPIFTMPLAY